MRMWRVQSCGLERSSAAAPGQRRLPAPLDWYHGGTHRISIQHRVSGHVWPDHYCAGDASRPAGALISVSPDRVQIFDFHRDLLRRPEATLRSILEHAYPTNGTAVINSTVFRSIVSQFDVKERIDFPPERRAAFLSHVGLPVPVWLRRGPQTWPLLWKWAKIYGATCL